MARQCEEREAARIRKAAARHAFPKLAVDRTFRSKALFLQKNQIVRLLLFTPPNNSAILS